MEGDVRPGVSAAIKMDADNVYGRALTVSVSCPRSATRLVMDAFTDAPEDIESHKAKCLASVAATPERPVQVKPDLISTRPEAWLSGWCLASTEARPRTEDAKSSTSAAVVAYRGRSFQLTASGSLMPLTSSCWGERCPRVGRRRHAGLAISSSHGSCTRMR